MEGQIVAGRYQLVRLIGRGGMGAVYEGRNTVTYKRCALKLLISSELASTPESVKRFFREARAGSVIESEYVVEVFDSGFDNDLGVPYMVMEFLSGEDVQAMMARLGAIEQIAAVKVVLQAATGLAIAHASGIVHRDVKPANLFLTPRDGGAIVVKILDFGIAKVKMENFHDTSTGLTRTGSMLGTPLYMSPEQCKGASSIDAQSDVWSLGVVLWELLTGGSPYSNPSSLGALMASIITEELPLIQDRAPWVAPELAEIVHRAMSRDLTKRYAHAGELRDALSEIAPGGAQLSAEMLRAVPSEHRAITAPRLVLSDEGVLRATGRTGLSMTQATAVKKRSAGRFVWLGAGAAAAAGLVATALALRDRHDVFSPSPSPSSPAPSSIRAASAGALPAEVPRVIPLERADRTAVRFPLAVQPPGVKVSVDGAPVEVHAGSVTIEGPIGATRRVRLSAGAKTEETVVAIVDSGLVPERLELGGAPRVAGAAAGPSKPRPDEPKPPPASPVKSAAPKPQPVKPAPRKAAGLSEETDEFK